MTYQSLMGYLILKFNSFVNIWLYYLYLYGVVYFFNDISTSYGLFNTEIQFICKYLIIYIYIYIYIYMVWFIFLMTYQSLIGYLILKFNSFVNIWLYYLYLYGVVYFFNDISTSYGLFNTEIQFICKYLIILFIFIWCGLFL